MPQELLAQAAQTCADVAGVECRLPAGEMRAVAQETVYIVQSFRAGRGARLVADPPVACKSEQTARRTAERLALSKVGVIAWSRTGDAELGDFDEDPIILFRAGRMPPELDQP